MKKLFILFVAVAMAACGQSQKKTEAQVYQKFLADSMKNVQLTFDAEMQKNETLSAETEIALSVKAIDTTERQEELFSKFKKLYDELKSFQRKADFIKLGFGVGGPYNSWLQKVQNLIDDKDSRLLASKGVVAGDLQMLGLTYVSTRGKENDVTKFFHETFEKAISSKTTQPMNVTVENEQYDKIRGEYELFGKWRVTNDRAKMDYVYEVYRKGSEYVGVILDKPIQLEKLDRKDTKFYLKGSTGGDYYLIDADKNMSLWDKKGSLASIGFKVSKVQ